MPMPLWMSASATMAAAAVLGLGLGSYATSPQARSPADEPALEAAVEDYGATQAQQTALGGPIEIKCTGCGPTLADRRWHADTAGWDAGYGGDSSDPVVRDYVAEEPVAPPPEPVVEQLPPNIERFAASDVAARPPVVPTVAQEASPPPSPPPVAVTMANLP